VSNLRVGKSEPSSRCFRVGVMRRTRKHQAPSTNLQTSSKSQAPNEGPSDVVAVQGGALAGLGTSLELGAWGLELPSRGGWDCDSTDRHQGDSLPFIVAGNSLRSGIQH
jgi:hypothetical protein